MFCMLFIYFFLSVSMIIPKVMDISLSAFFDVFMYSGFYFAFNTYRLYHDA